MKPSPKKRILPAQPPTRNINLLHETKTLHRKKLATMEGIIILKIDATTIMIRLITIIMGVTGATRETSIDAVDTETATISL